MIICWLGEWITRQGAQGGMMQAAQCSWRLFHHQKPRWTHPMLYFFPVVYTLLRSLWLSRDLDKTPNFHAIMSNLIIFKPHLLSQIVNPTAQEMCITLCPCPTSFNTVPCTEQDLYKCMLNDCFGMDWNYGWEPVLIDQSPGENSWWSGYKGERKSG